MNNDDIIVHHADNGGAIVVQDKTLYIKYIERQLSDKYVYIPLHSDPTLKFCDEIKTVLKQALREGQISDDEYKYMDQDNPIWPVIYVHSS